MPKMSFVNRQEENNEVDQRSTSMLILRRTRRPSPPGTKIARASSSFCDTSRFLSSLRSGIPPGAQPSRHSTGDRVSLDVAHVVRRNLGLDRRQATPVPKQPRKSGFEAGPKRRATNGSGSMQHRYS